MKSGTKKIMSILLSFMMAVSVFAGTAEAKKGDDKYQKTAVKIAKDYNATHADKVQVVKTIYWTAKTKAKLKVRCIETGKKVKLKANKKVLVIQRDYHRASGVSQVKLGTNMTGYIANKYLTFKKAKATGAKGDYSRQTKLAYINGQTLKSATGYLIWISLDKQRVNVFTGSSRNWNLIKEYRASSGAGESPTLDITFKRNYTIKWKKPAVDSMTWFSSFYGSGIHRFVGAGKKNMGRKPVSHSCVRVDTKNAKWIFDNIPLKTRVWIW